MCVLPPRLFSMRPLPPFLECLCLCGVCLCSNSPGGEESKACAHGGVAACRGATRDTKRPDGTRSGTSHLFVICLHTSPATPVYNYARCACHAWPRAGLQNEQLCADNQVSHDQLGISRRKRDETTLKDTDFAPGREKPMRRHVLDSSPPNPHTPFFLLPHC